MVEPAPKRYPAFASVSILKRHPHPHSAVDYHLLFPPLSSITFSYSCSLCLCVFFSHSITPSINHSPTHSFGINIHTHSAPLVLPPIISHHVQSFLRACPMKTLLAAIPAPAVDHPHPHSTVDYQLLFSPLSPISFSYSCSLCLCVFLSHLITPSINHSPTHSFGINTHNTHTPLLSSSLPPYLRRYSHSCGHAQ